MLIFQSSGKAVLCIISATQYHFYFKTFVTKYFCLFIIIAACHWLLDSNPSAMEYELFVIPIVQKLLV